MDDGSVLVCSRSAGNDLFPEQKGYVRGNINVSGYWIQPKGCLKQNDPLYSECHANGCKITLSAHTELGGSLPASLINMLSTTAPLNMLSAIVQIVSK